MKNFFPVAFLLLCSLTAASAPAYGQVNLGTSAAANNPQRSGEAGTGLNTPATGTTGISSAGTEMMIVNGTGVGIGTLSPQSLLTINKNASGVPASVGSFISTQLVGADAAVTGLEMDAFGDNNVIHFNRYDGTFSSQSALLSGDDIVSLVAGGYNGSALVTNKAGIQFIAGGNWSSTSTPEYLAFGTTAVGSTTKLERVRIDTTGNVGIGTTSPANPLSVNGVIESQSGGVKFPDGTTQTTAGTSTASTGMVLLATVNASAASSVSFNSTYITTAYNKYVLEFDGVYTSDAGTLYLTVSTNNGTSYLSSGYQWYGASGPFASQGQLMLGGPPLGFTQGVTGSSSTAVTAGTIKMSNLAQAVRAHFDWQIAWFSYDGAANPTTIPYVGSNTTTTAINAFQITDGSGGTITGNFHLYGLKGI